MSSGIQDTLLEARIPNVTRVSMQGDTDLLTGLYGGGTQSAGVNGTIQRKLRCLKISTNR
jgi:hypothetical protein